MRLVRFRLACELDPVAGRVALGGEVRHVEDKVVGHAGRVGHCAGPVAHERLDGSACRNRGHAHVARPKRGRLVETRDRAVVVDAARPGSFAIDHRNAEVLAQETVCVPGPQVRFRQVRLVFRPGLHDLRDPVVTPPARALGEVPVGADRLVVELTVLPLDRDAEASRRTRRMDLARDSRPGVADIVLGFRGSTADPADNRFLGFGLEKEYLLNASRVDNRGITRRQQPEQRGGEEGTPPRSTCRRCRYGLHWSLPPLEDELH